MSIITRHALVCDGCNARAPWHDTKTEATYWPVRNEGWRMDPNSTRHLCPDCAKEEG